MASAYDSMPRSNRHTKTRGLTIVVHRNGVSLSCQTQSSVSPTGPLSSQASLACKLVELLNNLLPLSLNELERSLTCLGKLTPSPYIVKQAQTSIRGQWSRSNQAERTSAKKEHLLSLSPSMVWFGSAKGLGGRRGGTYGVDGFDSDSHYDWFGSRVGGVR
jgi:hypothetical protein